MWCFRRSNPQDPDPPGVKAGQRLRLKGLGWPGRNGGEAGDLFVVVRIEG
ncbi:DnaJ C-terminal domain-containing protein [Streptomyces rochei]